MQDLIAELERRLTPQTDDLVSQLEARLATPNGPPVAPAPAPAPVALARPTGTIAPLPMVTSRGTTVRPQTPAAVRVTDGLTVERPNPRLGPAPPPGPPRVGPALPRRTAAASLGIGVDQAQSLGYGAIEALGELINSPKLRTVGGEGRRRNTEEAAQTAARFAPGMTVGQIDSVPSAVQWLKEAVMETAPTMAPVILGTVVAPVVGAPAAAGSLAAGLPLGVGAVQSAIKGRSEYARAPGAAMVGGALSTMLDRIVPGKIGTSILTRFGVETGEQVITQALAQPTTQSLVRRVLQEGAQGMVTEGATEALQEAIEDVAAAVGTGTPVSPDLPGQMLEAAARGAVVGGAMSGAIEALPERPRAATPAPTPTPAPELATPAAPAASTGRTPITGGDPARLAAMEQSAAAAMAALEQRLEQPAALSISSVETGETEAVPVETNAPPVETAAAPDDTPAGLIETLEQRVEEDAAPAPPVVATLPKFTDLLPIERREVRRILKELESFTYEDGRMQKIPYWERDKDDAQVSPRMANASVLHAINRGKSRTGAQVRKAVERYIEGRGRLTSVTADILRAAQRRASGQLQVSGQYQLPPEAGEVDTEIYVTPRRTGKPDEAKEIETIRKLDREMGPLLDAYLERFGGVFNADNASEILGPHEGDRRWAHHDAVRSSAGAMVQALYNTALAEPVDGGADVVVLTGGGTGSGKSSVVQNLPADTAFVLDSTLADYAGTKRNIEAARQSGRAVAINFTYRDPVDAFVNGVLTRLVDPENGRPVTTFTHASTHFNAPRTLLKLAEEYASEFDVAISVVENGSGQALVARDLDWLKQQIARYNDRDALRARLEDALAAEVDAGRVTREQAAALSPSARFHQADAASHDGHAQRDLPPAQRAPEEVASAGPRTDTLSTGEEQARLPGDVGDVRDQEIAQPTLEKPEERFELIQQIEQRLGHQPTMFTGAPEGAKPPATKKSSRGGSGGGAMFESSDPVNSAAFREWFGASKVVDKKGKPLVVYHGAPDTRFVTESGVFQTLKERHGIEDDERAFFFAADTRTAGTYASDRRAWDYQNAVPGIVPAYLRIENPMVIDREGGSWKGTREMILAARAAGHDGVIIRNVIDTYNTEKRSKPTTVFVVFDSGAIKHATRNRGTFDRSNPNILAESVHQSVGSPTRQLYVPKTATPLTGQQAGGRPISEQETVNRLRDIFSVDRVTPGWIRMVVGTARAAYPTRVGKVGPNAYGHYQLDSGLIRLRRAFDLPTMAHELGHMISFRLFGRTRPTGLFRDEIMQLGLATTPPGKVGTKYNFEEGIAEYFRTWFADPAQAHAAAPNFTAALEDWIQQHPAGGAQLLAAQTVVRRYNAQPAIVRGRARVNVRPAGVAGRAKDVVSEMRAGAGGFVRRFASALKHTGNLPAVLRDPHAWFDRLLHLWVDRHTAMNRAVTDMAAAQGRPLDVADNAYVLTRLAEGASGMAEGFLTHGPRGVDGQFTHSSLKAALSPIRHRLYPREGRTEPDFATYLVALRALELHADGKGRWPGLSPDEARAIVDQTHADPEAAAFKQAAKRVYSYLEGLRTYALQYGLITASLDAKLGRSLFYVPMQRVMDDVADRVRGASRIANRTSPIKRLKGSGRDIIDPIESIVKNTEALVNAVEKNRAAVALVKQARASKHSADWLVPIPTPQVATQFNMQQIAKSIEAELELLGVELPMTEGGVSPFDRMVTIFTPAVVGDPGDRIITVVERGKRVFYQVQDEALYQNITAVGLTSTSEIVKWAAKPTATLRAGATLRPSFIIRNLIRDTVGAMLQSRHGFVPVYDSLRGYLGMLRNDADYQRFMAFGVQSSSLLGQDRDRIREFIEQMNQPSSLRHNVLRVTRPIQLLRWLSENSEKAARLGEFKLALDTGGRERRAGVLGLAQRLTDRQKRTTPITERVLTTAALAARDVTIDFARGGTAAKELSQFKAFFNARLQGYVRIVESFRRDPVGVSLTVGTLAALGAALWVLNHDDEEYQELSDQERRDYWWIRSPLGEGWARIAKPFEWALVPNLVEAALDENLDAVDVMPVGDAQDLVWQLAPTGLLPFVEAAANYSSFTRRPIVSPYDTGLDPDLQVRDWTSDTARLAAKPIGVSPAKLEHVVYGLGGGLARDAVGIADPASRVLTGRNQPERSALPLTRRIPGLAAIAKEGGYSSSSRSIQEFYDELEAYQATVSSLRKRAGGEGMGSYEAAYLEALDRFPDATGAPGSGGEARLVVRRLDDGKRRMDALRDDLAAVRGSRDMTPTDKANEIRAIHEAMVAVAREALGRAPLRRTRPTRREMTAVSR